MSPGTVNCPTVIGLDVWNDLPRDYQSLILATKEPAYEKLIESYAAADKKNLPIFRKKMKEIKYDDKTPDRKSDVKGKKVSVSVDIGGGRNNTKKKKKKT